MGGEPVTGSSETGSEVGSGVYSGNGAIGVTSGDVSPFTALQPITYNVTSTARTIDSLIIFLMTNDLSINPSYHGE